MDFFDSSVLHVHCLFPNYFGAVFFNGETINYCVVNDTRYGYQNWFTLWIGKCTEVDENPSFVHNLESGSSSKLFRDFWHSNLLQVFVMSFTSIYAVLQFLFKHVQCQQIGWPYSTWSIFEPNLIHFNSPYIKAGTIYYLSCLNSIHLKRTFYGILDSFYILMND